MPSVLYPKERQLLEFITQYIQRYGYATTLKEIGAAMGTGSPATAHEHVDKLRQKGFIRKLDGTARGIEIIKENYRAGSNESAVELPVLGFIAAGVPLEPYTDPNYYVGVAPHMISSGKANYILQVKGKSMIDDGIMDGDFVIVQHQQ